jgi:hypothetical protein
MQRTAGCAPVSPPVRQETSLAPPHFTVIIPAAIIHPLSGVWEKLQSREPVAGPGPGSSHCMRSMVRLAQRLVVPTGFMAFDRIPSSVPRQGEDTGGTSDECCRVEMLSMGTSLPGWFHDMGRWAEEQFRDPPPSSSHRLHWLW